MAPTFYALSYLRTSSEKYIAGILFFSGWLLPSTYWYYKIFPWWLAFLASFGFVTLIANVFRTPNSLKNSKLHTKFILVGLAWLTLTWLRLNLPITRDWWIPDLMYTQWRNPLIFGFAKFGNHYAVSVFIIFSNALWAYLFLKKRFVLLGIGMTSLVILCLAAAPLLQNSSPGLLKELRLISIQSTTDQVNELKSKTISVLKENFSSKPTLVLWPENELSLEGTQELVNFVQEQNIYLMYDRLEPNGEEYPFETAVLLSPKGEELLNNPKFHQAPSEKIMEGRNFELTNVENLVVLTGVCYDLHYPDIDKRLKGVQLLLAPVDDAEFGFLQQYFHAADMVYLALREKIFVATSSTTGPTVVIYPNGEMRMAPFYIETELIVDQ